jgi:hypothetical protein
MFRVVTGSVARTVICAVVASTALLAPVAPVAAQAAVAAFDLQSGCLVGSIPDAPKLSVTWTGECVSGAANGAGNVIAFSNGRLQYLLNGEFRAGQLRTQTTLRDCSAGSAPCAADVPTWLVKQHVDAAAKKAASAPAPIAAPYVAAAAPAAPAVPAQAAAAEIRAPDAVYRGAFKQNPSTGVISGDGRVEFFDGRSYQGPLKNGLKDGIGTYTWADGQRYAGEWVNDLQQGHGVWTSRAGDRYEGAFVSGNREGVGSMTYASGMRYEGDWKANVETGRGKLQFVNGDVYEGDFVRGERTGAGVYRQKQGSTYSGQWQRGLREGNGVEEWANGLRYEGAWRANKKEGLGQMRYPDGGTYDGDWRGDQATGQGDIVFASGDVYTGQVRDGVPSGVGIFRWGSGDRFEGEFAAGKPTAKGQMTYLLAAVGGLSTPPVVPAPVAAAPAPAPAPAPVAAVSASASAAVAKTEPDAPPSRATLCASAFNAANSVAALRRFLDSFPDDECTRHPLARQKIAANAERDRNAARATDEKVAQAKTLIGAVVAFQQEFPFCVSGTGATCQRVTYVFDVKATIREIDVQKRTARVQISDATSLGNLKRAPAQLFADGRSAATLDYKTRNVGVVQSKSLEEVGLAF